MPSASQLATTTPSIRSELTSLDLDELLIGRLGVGRVREDPDDHGVGAVGRQADHGIRLVARGGVLGGLGRGLVGHGCVLQGLGSGTGWVQRSRDGSATNATTPRRGVASRRTVAGRVGYHRRRAARPSHGGPPERDRLMQQRSQVVTVAIIAAVVIGALAVFAFLNRGPDTGALTGRTWQLAAITGQTPSFQGVFPPEEQTLYTLEFATDGTLAAKADCNAVAGTYELSGNDGMTITLGASTLVACPDGSYGTIFAHELANVTTWAIASAELTLTTADGGSGTFVEGSGTPVDPSPSASPSDERIAERDRVAQPVARADPDRVALADPVPDARTDRKPDAGGDRHGCADRRPDRGTDGSPDRGADRGAHGGTDRVPGRPTPTPVADARPDPDTTERRRGPGRHELAARQHHDP